MHFFLTLEAAIIILVLGLVNLVTAALILFSCRTVPGLSRLLKDQNYKRFYKYHGYLWWILWPSVIFHAALAIARFIATY